MDINNYKNYQERTIAEYKVAIVNAKDLFITKIKEKDIIGALEATKLKLKLEILLNKKLSIKKNKIKIYVKK